MIIAVGLCLEASGQSLFTTPSMPIVGAFPNGGFPVGIVHADFTNDGVPDACTGGAYTNDIMVIPGTPAGSVAPAITTSLPPNPLVSTGIQSPEPIVAWDVNNDGNVDVICWMTSGIRVVFGLGNGTFDPVLTAPATPPPWPTSVFHLAGDDLDGDGLVEVVIAGGSSVTSQNNGMVTVYTAQPAGFLFPTYTYLAGAPGVAAVTIGDVTGDGLKDILVQRQVVQPFFTDLVILARTAGGSVNVIGPIPYPAGYIFIGDMNNDGVGDIVGCTTTPSSSPPLLEMIVSYGGPTSTFSIDWSRSTTLSINALSPYFCRDQLADYDLDGILDIRSRNRILRVSATYGGADGMIFDPHNLPNLPLPPGPSILAPQGSWDADGDGDLDVFIFGGSALPPPSLIANVHAGIALNQTIYKPGAASVYPMTLSVGTPAPGNPAFQLGIAGLFPSVPVALGLSHGSGFHPLGSGVISLDITPSALILPFGNLGILMTDAMGSAQVALNIPSSPALLGTDYFLQWLAVDPVGPITVGGISYSLSVCRRILLW